MPESFADLQNVMTFDMSITYCWHWQHDVLQEGIYGPSAACSFRRVAYVSTLLTAVCHPVLRDHPGEMNLPPQHVYVILWSKT
jgi:hypothetical protein